MLEGVDVSYAQGAYHPGGEDFVICNAARANVGLTVGSQYRTQVANARAAGKHVGHYFFNGNIDPVACANYFADHLLYQPGDSLWLDVESEPGTNTTAWSPAQALAFINQVRTRVGVTPGIYLNRSLMDGEDWSAVVATGAPLWIAYYNPTPPPIKWWPTWTVWQYTSTPIDRNKAQATSVAGLGSTPLEDDMPLTQADINLLLNYPAFDKGPSISTVLQRASTVYDAMFTGGPSMPDHNRSVGQSLDVIVQGVEKLDGSAGVDLAALADAVVKALPAVASGVTAAQVADELAKRLQA